MTLAGQSLLTFAACDGEGPCDDDLTPFGADELLLLFIACGAVIALASAWRRDAVKGGVAVGWACAVTAMVLVALWRMHDPGIPFGSDEALLAGVVAISLGVASVRRRRRSPSA